MRKKNKNKEQKEIKNKSTGKNDQRNFKRETIEQLQLIRGWSKNQKFKKWNHNKIKN